MPHPHFINLTLLVLLNKADMIGSVCSIYTFSLYNILLRKLEERTTWIVVGRLTIIRIIKKRAVNLGREFNGIWRVKCRALMNDLRKHWEMSWCSVKKNRHFEINFPSMFVSFVWGSYDASTTNINIYIQQTLEKFGFCSLDSKVRDVRFSWLWI